MRRVDYLEKNIKHLLEDVSWCNLVEEVHGRLEFDNIDVAAQVLCVGGICTRFH